MNKSKRNTTDKPIRKISFKRLINSALTPILIAISHLPFWVLFGISDLFYLIMRFGLKYRYKVITENLTHSFPDKTEKEINAIRNKFYRHFCDLIVESVKLYTISDKEMNKRLKITGTEAANRFYEQNRSIIAMAFHHNNWEWTSFVQSKLKHQILSVYNPLRDNNELENFLVHNREKWGSRCIPVNKTARSVVEYNLSGQLTGIWLAADQTPPANSSFWTIFMNREAPFFSGPEKIASKSNQPVFFQHTKKIGRGRYIIEYTLLFENPREVAQNDILLAYIRKCEEIITTEPEYYLWSHRRWKHKRPEGIELTL